jgi:hypothetical protein
MQYQRQVNSSFYGKKFTDKPTPFFRNGWKEIELPDFPKKAEKELDEIKEKNAKLTKEEIQKIKKQDRKNPPFEFEFLDLVDNKSKEYKDYIDRLTDQLFTICMYFKDKFKRKRPYQIAKENGIEFPKIVTETGVTPSYPSGHAMNSYFVAEILSRKYPEKKKELFDLAKQISNGRVQMGVHFPSDIEAGKLLAKKILPFYKASEELSFKEFFSYLD